MFIGWRIREDRLEIEGKVNETWWFAGAHAGGGGNTVDDGARQLMVYHNGFG